MRGLHVCDSETSGIAAYWSVLQRAGSLVCGKQHQFYDGNPLHFITATDRRPRLFDSPQFRSQLVEALNRLGNKRTVISACGSCPNA